MTATFDSSTSSIKLNIPMEATPAASSASQAFYYGASSTSTFVEPCPTSVLSVTSDLGTELVTISSSSTATSSSGTTRLNATATVSFDMRAVTTAINVNNGLMSLSDLDYVSATVLEDATLTNYAALYRNPFYGTDMEPIICFVFNSTFVSGSSKYFPNHKTGVETCVVSAGTQFFYPFTKHSGHFNFYTKTDSCWNNKAKCTPNVYSTYEKSFSTAYKQCDNYDIMIGLVYFPRTGNAQWLGNAAGFFSSLEEVVKGTTTALVSNGDRTVTDRASKAVQLTSDVADYFKYGTTLDTIESLFGAFYLTNASYCAKPSRDIPAAFRELGCSNCSMLTFRIGHKYATVGPAAFVSEDTNKLIINNDYEIVSNFSFHNNFYNPTVLAAMYSNPPVSLEQGYDICRYTTRAALQSAVGISFGNAQVLLAILVIVFLGGFSKYWNHFHYPKIVEARAEYTEDDSDGFGVTGTGTGRASGSGKKRASLMVDPGTRDEMFKKIVILLLEEDANSSLEAGKAPISRERKSLIEALKKASHTEDLDKDDVVKDLQKYRFIPRSRAASITNNTAGVPSAPAGGNYGDDGLPPLSKPDHRRSVSTPAAYGNGNANALAAK
jgi:hypothetical protein